MAQDPPFVTYEDLMMGRISFAGKDVLEIGCGVGDFTLEYLLQANSILGIDTDSEAIDRLREKWLEPPQDSRAEFRVGDVADYPLPKRAFDIAVFSHSF